MDDALLLRASDLPGVLDGWHGPVRLATPRGSVAAALTYADPMRVIAAPLGEPSYRDDHVFSWTVPLGDVFLDLTHAACRWQVVSRIAQICLDGECPEPGPRMPLWFFHWEMPYRARNPDRAFRLITIGRLRGWADREDCSIWSVLPGLDRIDPYQGPGPALQPRDDRRLPDGSRRADALAQTLLARHVGATAGKVPTLPNSEVTDAPR